MAVDGDAVSPSPPPPPPPSARVVAAVLALVRVALRPLLCLDLATAWVLSAIAAAMAVAHLAWGEGSAPFVFLMALTVAIVKSAFGPITRESIRELIKMLFPHAVVLGLVADFAFIMLSIAGALVMLMSPSVEGSISQGQMIGSVIMDVGVLGFHAISCFAIIPAFALRILREDSPWHFVEP